jgi:uncharacterized membrane protein YgdD (TMEM256/DUF423 family)
MTKTARHFLAAGGALALLAVALGAFGAHALKGGVSPDMLTVWHTASEYHFYHALGLIAVGLASARLQGSRLLRCSGWTMLAGIALFSGSLYALVLTGVAWLGAITPVGGVAFLVAWALFVAAMLRQ